MAICELKHLQINSSSNLQIDILMRSSSFSCPTWYSNIFYHTDGQKVKKSKKSTIFELEQNKEKNARFTLR